MIDQALINWLLGGFGALIGFLLNHSQGSKNTQFGTGWKVSYHKPDYTESYAAYFRFEEQ